MLSSSPAIWQRAIDQVLQNVPFTQCIQDDIIISGKSDDQHFQSLETVLKHLSDSNLKVNLDKCKFFKQKISYCGHEIDQDGLHKSPDKLIAVIEAPNQKTCRNSGHFLV